MSRNSKLVELLQIVAANTANTQAAINAIIAHINNDDGSDEPPPAPPPPPQSPKDAARDDIRTAKRRGHDPKLMLGEMIHRYSRAHGVKKMFYHHDIARLFHSDNPRRYSNNQSANSSACQAYSYWLARVDHRRDY